MRGKAYSTQQPMLENSHKTNAQISSEYYSALHLIIYLYLYVYDGELPDIFFKDLEYFTFPRFH